ncbi:MAG: hypothetical protein QXX41_05775 [Nitrososphaerota archaeon]
MSNSSIDWSKITPEKKKKFLMIAENLPRYKGIRGSAALISKELGVSGPEISLTRKLIANGVIKISEDGIAEWDEEAEKRLRMQTPPAAPPVGDISTAKAAVESTVQTHIAQRATLETELLLKAGEAYRREMESLLIEQGEKPENWAERNPDEILTEAFKALREAPRLREEINKLKQLIQFYEQRLDPDVRLQKGIEMLTNALILDRIYEQFGIDFLNSKAGKTYLQLIDTFIGGVLIE